MTESGPRPPKPVLLSDLGGVLVEDTWRCVAELLAKKYPVDPAPTCVLLHQLCPALDVGAESFDDFHRTFVQQSGIPVPLSEFREITLKRSLRLIRPTFRLYLRLRREAGVRIIVVSNIAEVLWSSIEQKFRISRALDGAVISSRVGAAKPDRRIFEAAIAAAGVGPADLVFVDDTAVNVRGAEAVGIPAFQVTGGPRQLRDLLNRIYGRLGRGKNQGGDVQPPAV